MRVESKGVRTVGSEGDRTRLCELIEALILEAGFWRSVKGHQRERKPVKGMREAGEFWFGKIETR